MPRVTAPMGRGLLIQRLARQEGKGLVLTPTRELVIHIRDALRPFSLAMHIRTAVVVGGESKVRQVSAPGKNPSILVATDIAAWDVGVLGIEIVVNYDLPEDPGSHVHRIGLTGRVGMKGRAISLATPDQVGGIRGFERLIMMWHCDRYGSSQRAYSNTQPAPGRCQEGKAVILILPFATRSTPTATTPHRTTLSDICPGSHRHSSV
jgi:superfamily II DNA/RNA helicase